MISYGSNFKPPTLTTRQIGRRRQIISPEKDELHPVLRVLKGLVSDPITLGTVIGSFIPGPAQIIVPIIGAIASQIQANVKGTNSATRLLMDVGFGAVAPFIHGRFNIRRTGIFKKNLTKQSTLYFKDGMKLYNKTQTLGILLNPTNPSMSKASQTVYKTLAATRGTTSRFFNMTSLELNKSFFKSATYQLRHLSIGNPFSHKFIRQLKSFVTPRGGKPGIAGRKYRQTDFDNIAEYKKHQQFLQGVIRNLDSGFVKPKHLTSSVWWWRKDVSRKLIQNIKSELKIVYKGIDEAVVALKYANKPFIEYQNLAYRSAAIDVLKNLPRPQAAVRTRLWASLKNPNSAAFNSKVVQQVQTIFDGNDAGRYPIEFAYRKLKKITDRLFSRISRALKQRGYKRFGQMVQKAENVEDLFTKTGGLLINSTVIVGYKIVKDLGFNNQLIQISFYPHMTSSAKNPNGKAPVFVRATNYQLKGLVDLGMSYYLKTWALSPNGRSHYILINNLFLFMGASTSFLKINGLRNLLSLTSNISRSFIKDGGISQNALFGKKWFASLQSAFSRNWKNRVGRFSGRVIIGGVATAFVGVKAGRFIGREAQRISSQIVIPTLTGSKKVSTKTVGGAIGTAFTSQLRRVSKSRYGYGAAITGLKYRRNAGIIQRIPGSITGGKGAFSKFKF